MRYLLWSLRLALLLTFTAPALADSNVHPGSMRADGSNLGLKCDVLKGEDGAFTSGSRTFTSATASFVRGQDERKRFTVRHGGANFFMTKATINNGGAGHKAGDLVTFPHGIQVYVLARDATGLVTAFYPVNLGSSSTEDATLTQSSTSGTGTGLVLTPTWVRENHVTYIQRVEDAHTLTLAAAPSATATDKSFAYGTDDGLKAQAALDADNPVRAPRGLCGHTQPFEITAKDVFVGQGAGFTEPTQQTLWVWLGSPGGKQVVIDRDAVGSAISGVTLGDFVLDGMGSAGWGWYARAPQDSHFLAIRTVQHTTVGHDVHGADSGADAIMNRYDGLYCTENTSDLNTHGVWLGFPNHADISADPDLSQFGPIICSINTSGVGSPMVVGAADHNTFTYIRNRGPAGVPGLDCLGSNWSNNGHCRDNHFLGVDLGAGGNGGMKLRGTGYANKPNNVVDFYDRANGAPVWDQEANSATFTASISGTTLTVTAVGSGVVDVGDFLDATGIVSNTRIVGYGTGLGGTGTYTVNESQTIGSSAFTSFGGAKLAVRSNNGQFDTAGILCQEVANLVPPNNPTSLACVNDASNWNVGELVAEGGTSTVIVAYTGTQNRWRIVAAVDSPPALLVQRASKSSDYQVVATESGRHFNNTGASGTVIFTLPPAADQLQYCFFRTAAQLLRVDAGPSVKISVGVNQTANDGYVEATTDQAGICLEAHGANQWLARSIIGTWTDGVFTVAGPGS